MRAVVDPAQFWSLWTSLDTCIEKLHDKINLFSTTVLLDISFLEKLLKK